MMWKNSGKDGLPAKDQKVLITVKGVNHIATYDLEKESFCAVNTNEFFSVKDDMIYWKEISELK